MLLNINNQNIKSFNRFFLAVTDTIIIVVDFFLKKINLLLFKEKKKSWLKFFLLLCLSFHILHIKAQREFKTFYFESGQKSSEGYIVNSIPVGVWKNYYENGKLKSEGKRKNNNPDSLWKFYSDLGVLSSEMNFVNGKKDGWEKKYGNDGLLKERVFYQQGLKEGFAYFYKEGKLVRKERYQNNVQEGYTYEFNARGEVSSILNYTNGFIKTRDRINQLNKEGEKMGKWIAFFPCPEPCDENYQIHKEERYRNGLKNGIFKEYNRAGELISLEKWLNGELITDADEVKKLDIQTEYYDNAQVKSTKSYFNGSLDGISKEYDREGKVTASQIYKNGNLFAEGIILESGLRDGYWKEYYLDGTLKAEGEYENGLKISEWKYYHPNGQMEQKGKYKKGEIPHGTWTWWYDTGNLKRTEQFSNGKEDGELIEYNDSGKVITKGEYVDGEKDGPWIYELGDYREEGEYITGEKTGLWIHYFNNTNTISYKGKYIDGIPVDKHTWYHQNGKRMLEGEYVGGLREGEWSRYDVTGLEILSIEYRDGNEFKINGRKIKPKEVPDEIDISHFKTN